MVAHNGAEGNADAAAENAERVELPEAEFLPHIPRLRRRLTPKAEVQTHFPTFRDDGFSIISRTTAMLEKSGFYWGPMTAEHAEATLKREPLGTFLIRDSSQKDFFFTLSYRTSTGPVNIRISFQCSRFSLVGSRDSFDCLFKLLEYYIASPKKILTKPHRRVKLQSLQELCRRRIIETCGGENISSVPVNAVLKDFLKSFPYRI